MLFDLNKSIAMLYRTPVVFSSLLFGLNEEWLFNNEGEDTWSPYDIIGHIIEGEKTDWIPRMRIILPTMMTSDLFHSIVLRSSTITNPNPLRLCSRSLDIGEKLISAN